MDKVNMTKNKNRRAFFRIYDEVNLLYKKIDESLLTEPQPVFNAVLNTDSSSKGAEKGSQDSVLSLSKLEQYLPDAQFKKDDVLNVNISASGIAFNCNDAFKEGDCLILKILLVSSMMVIETRCEVVYCTDTNSQSNNSECPYFIGAHFINMQDEDRELLVRHVDKKRLQRKWINAAILAVVIAVIVMPDLVFGLLLDLFHFLLELFLHVLHLTFEFIESNLDHLVEHLFETDVHQTQVIVFYIIVPFVFYGLYRLWRAVPPFCRRCKRKQAAYWSRKKANLFFYWREQSSLDKLKLIAIGVAVISFYILFGM